MSNLYYPDLQMAELRVTPVWATERVVYETGRSQQNAIRSAPLLQFSLRYDLLRPTQYNALLNFFHRHRGGFEAFWFRDYTDLDPTGRDFGVGDGTTVEFKLAHDAMDTCTVYIDGIAIPGAAIDLATGIVTFAVAPPLGSRLTYDATNARYRCRFTHDQLPSDRFKFIAWGARVELVQARDE